MLSFLEVLHLQGLPQAHESPLFSTRCLALRFPRLDESNCLLTDPMRVLGQPTICVLYLTRAARGLTVLYLNPDFRIYDAVFKNFASFIFF